MKDSFTFMKKNERLFCPITKLASCKLIFKLSSKNGNQVTYNKNQFTFVQKANAINRYRCHL